MKFSIKIVLDKKKTKTHQFFSKIILNSNAFERKTTISTENYHFNLENEEKEK